MGQTSSTISVCLVSDAAFIKISGKADSVLSRDFKRLIARLSLDPTVRVVLDLADCHFMDSTFLGILARFGNDRDRAEPKLSSPSIMNASAKIVELLDNLALLSVFRVSKLADLRDIQYAEVPRATETWSKEALTEHCLEAHRTLAALSSENAGRFKDVVHFLEEDLATQRGSAG